MLCMALQTELGWLVVLWPLHKLILKVRCSQQLLNLFSISYPECKNSLCVILLRPNTYVDMPLQRTPVTATCSFLSRCVP